MNAVTILGHRGHTVVRTVFPRNADLAGLRAVLAQTQAVYLEQPQGSILALVEFEDREFDQETIDLMETVAKANGQLVKATAFLGITGPQQALFKAMISITGRKARLYDSETAALDWLADEAEDPGLFPGF